MGFSDAYFANNEDIRSQLGHIVFLADSDGNCAPIGFKSYEVGRITRSGTAGDVISFSDLFEAAVSLSEGLTILMQIPVPLQLLTDSSSILDIILRSSRTSGKRNMLGIAAG